MTERPIVLRYEGDGCFTPVGEKMRLLSDEQFVVGCRYTMVEQQDRSWSSHRHYFASIKEGWLNLPDNLVSEYLTPEHLRKKMLIKCGFADEQAVTFETRTDAARFMMYAQRMDEYAVVVISGSVVKIYTAKSQSAKEMGRKQFQESKRKVLEAIEDLLEVKRGSLQIERAA